MKRLITETVRGLSVLFLGLAVVWTFVKYPMSVVPGLLALLSITALVYFMLNSRWMRSRLHAQTDRFYEILTAVMFCLSAAVVLLCGSQLAVNHSWDWGRILDDAMNYTDRGTEPDILYYARYPNNQFMFRVLVYAFRFFRLFFPTAPTIRLNVFAILLSCAMILLAYLFLYLTAKEKYGSKYMFFSSIIILLYTPSYLYATFAYTDTFSFPFNAAILYLYARRTNIREDDPHSRRKACILLSLIGILGGIGARFKIFSLIYLIAILISEFAFTKAGSRLLTLLVSAVVLICTAAPAYLYPPNTDIFDYDQSVYDQYRFPYEHWIMMGLNEEGGYMVQDVIYTRSYESFDEKKAADLEAIQQRIQEKGVLGLARHFLRTKVARAWAAPTLAADDYVSRSSLHEDGLLRNIFGKQGKYHPYYLAYQCAIHVLLFLLLITVALFRTRQHFPFFTTLTILGMFLFLSFWESTSRYLYSLIPCFLINALDGVHYLSYRLSRQHPAIPD